MTGMDMVFALLAGGQVVNPLPFPGWVFALITFAICLTLLLAVRRMGKSRPHS